jgi:parallel beta-helix repeat protein
MLVCAKGTKAMADVLAVRRSMRRTLTMSLTFSILCTLVGALLVFPPSPADAATTFVVNGTSDAEDAKISDSRCDTSRNKGNQCTLRAAIQEANDTPGADAIHFNIGGTASIKTISPNYWLPEITGPVTIDGYTQPGASPNTSAEGTNAVLKVQLSGDDQGGEGIGLLVRGSRITIRGLVINRFGQEGILIYEDGPSQSSDNKVKGNFLGTDASGKRNLSLGASGVWLVDGTSENTIGGATPGARNLISGNSVGVTIGRNYLTHSPSGTKVVNNTIRDNYQGVVIDESDNNALKNNAITDNYWSGVLISRSNNNTIGGASADAGNLITGNAEYSDLGGVQVSGTGNRILSNLIYSNGELGIDLSDDYTWWGVSPNDTDDPDTGPNNLQNFPDISSAVRDSTTGLTTVTGTLNSNPSQTYTIQCFATEEGGDPSGHGEGKVLLETTTATTDANGDGSFTCASHVPAVGDEVSATATNTATGDTSEFSQNVAVTTNP